MKSGSHRAEEGVDDGDNLSDDEDDVPPRMCCISGGILGCTMAFLFLLILPAGILLTVYSTNTGDTAVLGVSVMLLALPVLSVPVLIVIFHNRRRIRRIRKRKVSSASPIKPELVKY